MNAKAHCKYCPSILKIDKGTGGITKHTKSKHAEQLASTTSYKKGRVSTKTWSVASHFPTKPKPQSYDQMHKSWLQGVVNWVVETSQPFTAVTESSFRSMFKSTHQKAGQAVLGNGNVLFETTAEIVRDEVCAFGSNVKKATNMAMRNHNISCTTDHWTGPSKETFTTVTSHWIDQSWKLQRGIMDFKVYKGKATGEKIDEDLQKVFADHQSTPENVTIIITDTTESQGKLGVFLRNN